MNLEELGDLPPGSLVQLHDGGTFEPLRNGVWVVVADPDRDMPLASQFHETIVRLRDGHAMTSHHSTPVSVVVRGVG